MDALPSGFVAEDTGAHNLKGFASPVTLFRVEPRRLITIGDKPQKTNAWATDTHCGPCSSSDVQAKSASTNPPTFRILGSPCHRHDSDFYTGGGIRFPARPRPHRTPESNPPPAKHSGVGRVGWVLGAVGVGLVEGW